jgi:signal transduction histidine kinase
MIPRLRPWLATRNKDLAEDTPTTPARRSGVRNRKIPRGVLAGLGLSLFVSTVAIAVVFSIANSTVEVAKFGTTAVQAEATLSAASATRNRAVQAQLLSEANLRGIATEAEVAESRSATAAAAEELDRRAARLIDELDNDLTAAEIASETSAFIAVVNKMTVELSGGEHEQIETALSSLDEAYAELAGTLVDERDKSMARIHLARDSAGRLADGARFLVALFVPLGVLFAYRARIRREQRSRALEQRLDKEQAVNRTKDELIANLSHELRTPLTSIYGFALEMTDHEILSDPTLAAELAKVIAAEASELARMLEDLLTAATADHGGLVISIEEVDPATEITEVLAPVKLTGVTIPATVQPALILADRFRLRQIVRNLVSNARQHGGPNATITGRIDGERYAIEVRDDGPGIPSELEERLFTRFIHEGTTPLTTGSVGLGLAIAQLLSSRTGGTISYRRDGNTTVFAVTYPLASPLQDTNTGQTHAAIASGFAPTDERTEQSDSS